MFKKYVFLSIFVLVLISAIVSASTIHGTIYNFYLEEQEDSVVSINTIPKQIYVSKDGSYSFDVDTGDYILSAKYLEGDIIRSKISESVLIESEGNYVVDMILFPVFEDDLLESGDISIEDEYFEENVNILDMVLFVLALFGFGIVIYFIVKYYRVLKEVSREIKETSDQDKKNRGQVFVSDEKQEVLDFIKKKGGRITQKEIRKNFPSSEAKISLIISELEHDGVIRKIKKGRGNIIVLIR